MILCECGEFLENNTFKDYIKTSSNPSTPTIGHSSCGLIFDFIDGNIPKIYSSRTELKKIAARFGESHGMDDDTLGCFLLKVDRLKSEGNLADIEILYNAFQDLILMLNRGSCTE